MTELVGKQMTTRQLAEALPDIPQASLYRHIKRLIEAGVLEVVATEMVQGAQERTLGVVAGQDRLTPEEAATLSPEAHIDYFSTYAAGLVSTFARYAAQAEPADYFADGLSYNQTVLNLTDSERETLREGFAALLRPYLSQPPTPERRRYTLGSIVIPDERRNI